MNHYSQQSSTFQGQPQFQNGNKQQPYKSNGFVQSHYQGQLSQPSFGGRASGGGSQMGSRSQSQPQGFVHSAQYHGAPMQQSYAGTTSNSQTFGAQHRASGHAATSFGNVGPVIAHTGYQAGTSTAQRQSQHQPAPSQSFYQPSFNQNTHAHRTSTFDASSRSAGAGGVNNSSYSMNQTGAQTPLNPVYQATHAFEQAGPVIAKTGGWQAASGTNGQWGGQR